ncbi:hypothetical protein KDA_76810 [Dictyobacter alpinus]|uniref:Uncharacterized protein n=1 Tax=Dictyobacter alpinus TaxID=2014873 RepID=A0A402BLG8_9CHLR|nr:hypothetical protein [Dictyobacter alpinus]GCE32197.1 hypothetical protein KDA_76810 [Dictyobacter alpinus]
MAKLMQKVYLDMFTVCDLLKGRTAVICADVRLPGEKLKARGSVFLRGNAAQQIAGAIIESGDSRLLYSGDAALAVLKSVAEWSVYFTGDVEVALADYLRRLGVQQQSPSGSRQESSATSQGGPPLRRLQHLPESMLEPLSLKDRLVLKTVWSMVNNQRSLEEVQSLLKLPPAVVADAVETLRLFQVLDS